MGNSGHDFQAEPRRLRGYVHRLGELLRNLCTFEEIAETVGGLRKPELARLQWLTQYVLARRDAPQDIPLLSDCDTIEIIEPNLGRWKLLHKHSDASKLAYRESADGDFQVIDYAIPNPIDGLMPTKPDFLLIEYIAN